MSSHRLPTWLIRHFVPLRARWSELNSSTPVALKRQERRCLVSVLVKGIDDVCEGKARQIVRKGTGGSLKREVTKDTGGYGKPGSR